MKALLATMMILGGALRVIAQDAAFVGPATDPDAAKGNPIVVLAGDL